MFVIVMFWYVLSIICSDLIRYVIFFVLHQENVVSGKIDFCINLLISLNWYSHYFNTMILLSKYRSSVIETTGQSFWVSMLLFKFPLASLHNTLVLQVYIFVFSSIPFLKQAAQNNTGSSLNLGIFFFYTISKGCSPSICVLYHLCWYTNLILTLLKVRTFNW